MSSFSVCIPSSGRKSLNYLLQSIRKQSNENIEIIVAGPKNLVSIMKKNEIHIVSEEGSASERRNLAANCASNEYVVFIDDDCILKDNFFNELNKNINPIIYAYAGGIERLKNNNPIDIAWLEAGFDKYFGLSVWRPYLRWAPTANFTIKRDVFNSTQGFEKLSVPVGGEDVLFCLNLIKLGLGPIKSVPSANVFHLPITDNNLVNVLRKANFYGQSEQIIAKNYPDYEIPFSRVHSTGITKKISDAFYRGRLQITDSPKSISLSQLANIYNNKDVRIKTVSKFKETDVLLGRFKKEYLIYSRNSDASLIDYDVLKKVFPNYVWI